MLNFQKKKPTKGHGFTLDRVEHERNKAPVARRRHLHLFFLAGVAIISGSLLWSFLDQLSTAQGPATNRLKQEIPLVPMARPSIADLPALPDAAAITEQNAGVADHLAKGTVPLWIDQPDAGTLAWIAAILARDRSAPPLPQRVDARDLAQRHVTVGENVVLSGMLEDSRPAPIAGATNGYQRLLVALPDQQFVEILAPDSTGDLVIGDEVLVVGRFLGFAVLPPADDAVVAPLPPVAGQAVEAQPPAKPVKVEVPLIAARSAAKPVVQRATDNPYVMRGEWKLPADIYENVDDNLLLVETRPYYFTIGQVLQDRTTAGVWDKIPSANEQGSAIHKEPSKFRGQPFSIHGYVFHAWEDLAVAQDQPFGVSRVVRVILWSEDRGDWEVNDGGTVKTSSKLILRAFEIAAITHEPLPQVGDQLTANGRFLRLRAMEVKPKPNPRGNSVQRQSDRAYTFLFVADDFTKVPEAPHYDLTWLKIGVVLVAVFLAVSLLVMARSESRKKDEVFASVRKFRETRNALKGKAKDKAAVAGTPDAPTPTPAPESPEPPAG